MELTGSAGQFGQAGAKSVELAFRDLNEAGGPAGCRLAAEIRDSQSQGSVGVDVAKQLVEIKRVPVIIGGIISSVSIPILTSVTAPSGIVQISPASSSPTLTNLGREGKSGGWFFRTITTDALQGVAAARYALDTGFKRLSVIHVNNDFGVNMVREFTKAYQALGGQIISTTPYNPSQASYQPEVTRAISGNPDALYLVSYPGDGTTIARTWISQGGVKKFLLNDGMNSAKFIADVGPQHLNDAYGTSSGTVKTPSTEYFAREYPPFSKFEASAPGRRSFVRRRGHPGPGHCPGRPRGVAGHPRRHSQGARPQGHGHPRRRSGVSQGVHPHQGRQAHPLRRRHRTRAVRPLRRHHRAVPSVAHPGRPGGDGRRAVGRGRRSAQGQARRLMTDEAGPRPLAAPPSRRARPGKRWPATRERCASATASSCPGTTASGPTGTVGVDDPAAQARFILDRIERALVELGARLRDVVRTRVYVRRLEDWEAVARVHGERFVHIRPANTLVQAQLVGDDLLVEIEAEAVIGAGDAL